MQGFCKWPLQLSQRFDFCNATLRPNKKSIFLYLLFLYSCSKINLPSRALQNGSESEDFALWEEPYKQARKWKPCAAKHSLADEGSLLCSNSTAQR
jgi:hypothetical protein